MGAKTKNLKVMLKKEINVHEFTNAKDLEELLEYAKDNPKFSIRFDRDTNYKQLPFYTYKKGDFNSKEEELAFFTKIAKEAKKMNCTLLCSNGLQYDNIQICNFVICFTDKENFVLEWSTKKVALRNMYEYPTTILKGNIKDDIKDMECIQPKENRLDKKDIEKILVWALSLKRINKSIEGTLYPKKVGMLKQEIVCWQID